MDFQQLFDDARICESHANYAHSVLSNHKLNNCVVLDTFGWCFRILLPLNGILKAISVSIPPDANKGISRNHHTKPIYETALIGFNDEIIYNKGLFYNDVKQFDSIHDVADEVKRIIRTVT
jgi:hypothetical protein